MTLICAQDNGRAGGFYVAGVQVCAVVTAGVSRAAARRLQTRFSALGKNPLNIERSRIQNGGANGGLAAQSGNCSHHSHFFVVIFAALYSMHAL